MKRTTKRGRVFLNTPRSQCLGAVCWHVGTMEHWNPKKKGELVFEAEIDINRAARSHYIARKGNMLPIYRMRDELNKFIAACEEGLERVHSAKDST